MQELVDSALARIHSAQTAEDLEAVRVEVLGRKGVLTQLSKDMGKLPAEERASRGKFINTAKQALEEAKVEEIERQPVDPADRCDRSRHRHVLQAHAGSRG